MSTQISRKEKRASLYKLVRIIARKTGRSKAEVLQAVSPTADWYFDEEVGLLVEVSAMWKILHCA